MEPAKLDDTVIALLFAADEAISARKMASVIENVDTAMVNESLDRLKERFTKEMSSIVLEHVAGGFQLSTNSEYADFLARLYSGRRKQRLSKAGMETLAIIAYKQPITRADIEAVRGVGCGGVVTTLMERSLIQIVGKAKVLGAPFLYGTTHEFLEYLGLNTLKDLPSMEELEALLEKEEAANVTAEQVGEHHILDAHADEAPGETAADAGETSDEFLADAGETSDETAANKTAADAGGTSDEFLANAGETSDETAADETVATEASDDASPDERIETSEDPQLVDDSVDETPAATVEPWTVEHRRSQEPAEPSDNEPQQVPVDERDT